MRSGNMKMRDLIEGQVHRVRDFLVPQFGKPTSSVDPSTPLCKVAGLLEDARSGAVVVRENDVIVGILSESDVLRAILSSGRFDEGLAAQDVMTKNVQVVDADQTCAEALSIMVEGGFRHLPVVEGGKFIGILPVLNAALGRMVEAQNLAKGMQGYLARNPNSIRIADVDCSIGEVLSLGSDIDGVLVALGDGSFRFVSATELLRAKLRVSGLHQ